MRRLDPSALDDLPDDVAVPRYPRGEVPAAVVHVGVGGFHRAHQARYLHRLLVDGGDPSWSICGVGLMPGDAEVHADLREQGHLYSLTVLHPDGRRETEVVGSVVEDVYAPDDPSAAVARLADPATRVVTLTVTEGGYGLDEETGELDPDTPGVADDVARRDAPSTVFGLVVEALARRRAEGRRPFTVVSCDNLAGNGDVARRAFTGYARLVDPELADWITAEVAFPTSMVDRITPATDEEDAAQVDEALGVHDARPVVTEPFIQWVLEDRFTCGRPPLERVGVQLVDDVEPYELMKLRLLNAAHQVVGHLARLAGLTYVHEAFADPVFRGLCERYLADEASPTLPEVPGVDLEDYRATLLDRFANPHIGDTLERVCTDASDRVPVFLVPVLRDRLAQGGDVAVGALAIAGWARHLEGTDDDGRPLEVLDRRRDELVDLAARQDEDPTAVLAASEGLRALADDDRFRELYVDARERLVRDGARAAAQALVDEDATSR